MVAMVWPWALRAGRAGGGLPTAAGMMRPPQWLPLPPPQWLPRGSRGAMGS